MSAVPRQLDSSRADASSSHVSSLPGAWRDRAALLRAHGAEAQAVVLELVANELEAELRAADVEVLTIPEAAAASGYSEDRIRKLIAGGTIPNAGKKHAPRVRRCDLPTKSARARSSGYDAGADALRLVTRGPADDGPK